MKPKALILPPAGPLLVGFAGLVLLLASYTVAGTALIAASLATLYLLSAPLTGRPLMRMLDRYPPLDPDGARAGAIVILDAGRRRAPADRGGDAVSGLTLDRLFEGARVYRRLEAPVLVSGNGARELMAEVLYESFGVPVRWIEPESRNTWENATCSARVLRAEGIDSVVLVTHYWHMPRAAAAFRRTGLTVTPAPLGFEGTLRMESGLKGLIPSPQVLYSSYLALHEWIGILWYRLRYR